MRHEQELDEDHGVDLPQEGVDRDVDGVELAWPLPIE